jgi:hypothetical protein
MNARIMIISRRLFVEMLYSAFVGLIRPMFLPGATAALTVNILTNYES